MPSNFSTLQNGRPACNGAPAARVRHLHCQGDRRRVDKNEQRKEAAARLVLAHVETRSEKATTHQLADELGMTWQSVSKALKRLAARQQVLVSEVEHKDCGYRVRRVRHYQRNIGIVATLPEWLAPRVHEVRAARVVKGCTGVD